MAPSFDLTDQLSANVELLYQLCSLALFCLLVQLAAKLFTEYLPELGAGTTAKTLLVFSLMTVVSLTVYFWTDTDPSNYFMTLVISLILGTAVFHPALAMTAICGLLILRAWEIRADVPVLAILPRVSLLVFAVSFLLSSVREGRFAFSFSKIQLGVLALGVWVFLSTIVSDKMIDSQAAFLDGFLKSLVAFFLIFQSVRTMRHYQTVVAGLVVAVLGIAVLALFNTFVLLDKPRLELIGAMKNSNDLAAIFVFILPFVLRSLINKSPASKTLVLQKCLAVAIAIVILAATWKAQSRAAYLAIFCTFLIWLGFKVRHNKRLLIAGLITGLLGVGVLSGLQLGRESSDLEGSRQNRLGFWKAGIAMAVRHPLLGVGYSRYPFQYQSYGDGTFTEFGQRTAHSSWILLVAEAGVPALMIFVGLFAMAFQRAWQLGEVAPELFMSLTGYGIAMSFLSHVYTIYPFILLALIFAYPKKGVRHESSLA